MRYDKKVEFLREVPAKLNTSTREMSGGSVVIGQKMCHQHDLSTQMRVEVFGRADVRAIALHHLGRMLEADLVRVEGRTYRVTVKRSYGLKASYIAQEVKV